jgi:hypothetical protein
MAHPERRPTAGERLELRHRNPLAHDYVIVSRVILIGYPQVSDGAKLTYWVIYSHDWYEASRGGRKGYAYPTIGRLARLRNSTERTIQRHLAELIEAELLTREMRPGKASVLYIEEPSSQEVERYLGQFAEGGDNSGGGGVTKMSPHKQEEEKQINPDNGVEEAVMEENGHAGSQWPTIGEILKDRKIQPEAAASRTDWLAQQMIEQTGDHEGSGCYRVIAGRAPEPVIFEALSLLKEARHEGGVRRPGALFVSIVRRLCEARHLPDPLPKQARTGANAGAALDGAQDLPRGESAAGHSRGEPHWLKTPSKT